MLQQHIDSIESHRNDSLAAKTDEVTEKETETESPWAVRIVLVCVAIFLGFIISIWKKIAR
jgi:hypothetical protein